MMGGVLSFLHVQNLDVRYGNKRQTLEISTLKYKPKKKAKRKKKHA